jgi:dTDP-4-dehydrorhamnose reductase
MQNILKDYSDNMKILIVGRGWTGKKMFAELTLRGHEVTMCSHSFVEETIQSDSFDWLVNCAGVTGYPNVDACELHKKDTIEANTAFPILLHSICVKHNIRMAHFSSGCIYQGEITSTNAEPNYFGSIYSISKGVSDVYLGDKAQVYRIRMPFTSKNESKNYLTKVYNYAKNAKLYNGGQNSLTDLDEAVKVASDLIEEGESNGYYNLVNSGSIDMKELAELMGITSDWFTEDEFKAATAAGRSNCTIPSYERMTPIKDALHKAIKGLTTL